MLTNDDKFDRVDLTGIVNTAEVHPIRKLHSDKISKSRLYLCIKRFFDVVASLMALVLISPIMIIIILLIKIDSKGPVLYKQIRLGLNGKPFEIIKFRSMYVDAEIGGAQWAADCDNRITRVGSLLRKTRFDEVPQFAQVIKGEMSLIGPRPERPEFYNEFEKYLPGFSQRLAVKPGITGLAQVNGGYSLRPEEKVAYDLDYIENMSLTMDVKIILGTLRVLLFRDGAR